MIGSTNPLAGRRILVVEDDYLIARYIADVLEQSGVEVIGPAENVETALRLVSDTPHLDGAMLDLDLRGKAAFPVADLLQARGVPFVFMTGYDSSMISAHYKDVRHCGKPVDLKRIVKLLFG